MKNEQKGRDRQTERNREQYEQSGGISDEYVQTCSMLCLFTKQKIITTTYLAFNFITYYK